MEIILLIYLVLHLPAIILLLIGISLLKTKPENARILIIIAIIYFIIGGGICASMFKMH